MRYCFVDNSTLTAVQRLMGDIEVQNTITMDGDIAAFENFVQAILFYDEIFFIDDYKEGFRTQRANRFPYLISISPTSFPYDKFVAAASTSVDDIFFSVKGGKIKKNEIGNFLELLKMRTTFTWDMKSSEWFLTMKMIDNDGGIDIEKYSALSEMIFSEGKSNQDTIFPKSNETKYELVTSDGRNVSNSPSDRRSDEHIEKNVKYFASNINWLALRTAFYTYISNFYEADAILHPIRSAFQLALSDRLGFPSGFFNGIIKRLHDESSNAVSDIRATSDSITYGMNVPVFSAWLVHKTGNPKNIVEAAFDIRQKSPFLEARQQLIEIEELLKNPNKKNFVSEINKLSRSISSVGDTLRQIYGVQTKNGVSVSPLISIANSVGALNGLPPIPAIPLKIALPK